MPIFSLFTAFLLTSIFRIFFLPKKSIKIRSSKSQNTRQWRESLVPIIQSIIQPKKKLAKGSGEEAKFGLDFFQIYQKMEKMAKFWQNWPIGQWKKWLAKWFFNLPDSSYLAINWPIWQHCCHLSRDSIDMRTHFWCQNAI